MLWAGTQLKIKSKLLLVSAVAVLLMPLGIIINAQPALAADAVWKNNTTITYNGTDFSGPGTVIDNNKGSVFTPKNSSGCGTRIYFAGDYKTSSSAEYQVRGQDSLTHACAGWSTVKKISITPQQKGSANPPGTSNSSDGAGPPPCDGGSLGWIICPAIDLMQNATNAAAGFLDGQLQINGGIPMKQDGKTSDLYKLWQNILTVANIILVFAFLALIFSQATSVGLSSYGVKKLLPRIIAAAILMNLSFFICQIMVDFSNILGAGAGAFVNSATGGGIADNVSKATSSFTSANIAGQVILGTIAAAVILFFFLIPVVIAFLVVVFVIAARLAIVYLLIMIAPLAFAAWVLPNTDKYFKKWWDLFINMLTLYPMVMFIFAAAIIASHAILQTDKGTMGQLIALLVMAMPLFALPTLFKASSSTLAKIGDMTQRGLKRGGGDALHNAVSSRRKEYMATRRKEIGANLAGRFGSDYEASGRFRRSRTAMGRAAGWAARSPMRKMDREERKANADLAYKTLHAEERATEPEGRSAQIEDRKFELESRASAAGVVTQGNRARQLRDDRDFADRAAGVGGDAARRRILAQANATLTKEQTEGQRLRHEAVESIQKSYFNGDFDLEGVWLQSGGDANHASVANLNAGQRQVFDEMVASGLHERAESFEAALTDRAASGRGNGGEVDVALQRMADLGYEAKDIGGLSELVRATYRSKGRGDLVGRVGDITTNVTIDGQVQPMTTQGFGAKWDEVKAKDISRFVFDDPQSTQSLVTHLSTSPEYTRSTVMGLDDITDQRAKAGVVAAIENAWRNQSRPDGSTYSGPDIISQLRDDFRLNPGGGSAGPVAGPTGGGPTGP